MAGFGIEEPACGEYDAAWEQLRPALVGKRVLTYSGRIARETGSDERAEFFLRFAAEHRLRGWLTP